MANSTKIAIVGLMILLVVVVAQWVKNDTPINPEAESEGAAAKTEDAAKTEASESGRRSSGARMASNVTNRRPTSGDRPSRANRTGSGGASGLPRNAPFTREVRNPSGGGRFEPLRPRGRAASGDDGGSSSTSRSSNVATTGPGVRGSSSGPLVSTETTRDGTTANSGSGVSSRGVAPPISNAERRRREEANRRALTRDTRSPATEVFPAGGTGTTASSGDAGSRAGSSSSASDSGGDRLAKKDDGTTGLSGRSEPGGGTGGATTTLIAKKTLPTQHLLVRGESPWALSERYYGSGEFYPTITAANKSSKFRAGDTVTIPKAPAAALKKAAKKSPGTSKVADSQKKSSVSGKKSLVTFNPPKGSSTKSSSSKMTPSGASYTLHKVRRGETLTGLAKRFYGSSRYSYLIENANEELKYTVLRAGSTIRIPKR